MKKTEDIKFNSDNQSEKSSKSGTNSLKSQTSLNRSKRLSFHKEREKILLSKQKQVPTL